VGTLSSGHGMSGATYAAPSEEVNR
jgi:hypothetical protein